MNAIEINTTTERRSGISLAATYLDRISVDGFLGLFTTNRMGLLTKRSIDVVVSSFSLLFLSPVFLLIAISIKAGSPGEVLFRSLRIGKERRPFFMYKFRTMRKDAEKMIESDPSLKSKFEIGFKLKDDSRVTKLGKFLRRSGLDELPQLINILLGDMSLVGPRPILKEELKRTPHQRFQVPPGLTGLWQISGKSALSYEKKCELDNHYALNRTIIFDIKIVFKTIPAIVKGRGFF